jgi:glyoxylase-like metal-dependent hydrolase (beta-lactamase superfamily II)
MTTRTFLAVLLALPLAARGQLPDFSRVEIKVSKVSGAVYLLEGAGGNIAVSVGDEGLVVVDDQFAPLAEKIRAALRGVSDQPIRFILNTHWHFDHVGGNADLGANATVMAHENVRKRMAAGGTVGNLASLKFETPPAAKEALPVVTFTQGVSIHVNGEEVRAFHVPHGHTDGDTMVLFTRSNVLHAGDDFVTGFPLIDLASGGSVKGLLAGWEKVLPQLPADVRIVRGHGPLATVAELREWLAMVRESSAAVEKAVRAGKGVDAIEREGVLKRWEKEGAGFVSVRRYAEALVNEFTGKATSGPPGRH